MDPIITEYSQSKLQGIPELKASGIYRQVVDITPLVWERLLQVVDRHDVSFKWVRGHMGHPENERFDELANGASHGSDVIVDKVVVKAGG